jgi:hypothetical protein
MSEDESTGLPRDVLGAIGASVIHDHHIVIRAQLPCPPQQRGERRLFIEGRNNDQVLRRRSHDRISSRVAARPFLCRDA